MRHFFRTTQVFMTYQNEILLLFHKKHKKWFGVGGHIEENEMAHEAAIREVKEETGIDLIFPEIAFSNRATKVVSPDFICRYTSEDKIEEDYSYWVEVDEKIRRQLIVSEEDTEALWLPFHVALDRLDMYSDTIYQVNEIRSNYYNQ